MIDRKSVVKIQRNLVMSVKVRTFLSSASGGTIQDNHRAKALEERYCVDISELVFFFRNSSARNFLICE